MANFRGNRTSGPWIWNRALPVPPPMRSNSGMMILPENNFNTEGLQLICEGIQLLEEWKEEFRSQDLTSLGQWLMTA